MKLHLNILGICAAVTAAGTYKPQYRISPIDGSKIALPTKEQLDFQDKEIGVLIHFEIATYLDIDGCNNVPNLVPNVDLFDPTLINTDAWMDTTTALGAKYATLVAKHNCGFTTWPSNVTFQNRDNETVSYNYTIAHSPVHGQNIVRSFVDSAQKYNIGHGFYYSVVVNNFLNVQNSGVRAGSWAPGQVNITNSTYDQVVLDQLGELWKDYGSLTEIWFDGGYSSSQQEKVETLLESTQPQAVIFNGCDTDGNCLSANSSKRNPIPILRVSSQLTITVRWIGTEEGQAPEENWSTGVTNDGGDPTSPYFCPAECDTTLQTEDRWFFGVDQPLRSIEEMIDVYHRTVGRNCLLELDLTPDRSGLIPASYAARYKQLGDFISSCYDNPIAPHAAHSADDKGVYTIKFDYPTAIDRIVLMEDQTNGQVIRSYQVQAKVVDSQDANGTFSVSFSHVSNGTSIGHKKIDIFEKPISVTEVRVKTTYVDTPKWRSVSVHLCDQLSTNSCTSTEAN
ncbi:Glycoside hydrolase family 29 [Penicillium argentinense]|uniref:alpha-L-fucosidase n=1 Tax=Penicillium argentinense TaxID=1131581 RepID=A0A9W9K2B0_9EURO|nr:Glycoside hydrolase family 29 [Penicillium argentinense]KAJ5090524.1 Glycoside hydrolase family 29 [Penicillium argentinense]